MTTGITYILSLSSVHHIRCVLRCASDGDIYVELMHRYVVSLLYGSIVVF